MLRWRQARLVQIAVQRAKYFDALELIQAEYRTYIETTKSAEFRNGLRIWRNSKEKVAAAAQRQLGLNARDAGSAIAQEEASEWRQLLSSASSVKMKALALSESERRGVVVKAEADARALMMSSAAEASSGTPPELRPGSIEMEEFLRRCHITQFYLIACRPMFANALRLHAYCLGRLQDDRRLDLVREEVSARVLLLQRMRQSFYAVRLAEERLLEQALRKAIADRREQFVRTVHQKYCVSLMSVMSGELGEQSEGGLRQRLVDWEHQYWLDLMNEFHSKTYFLTFARCYSDEHAERIGGKDSIEKLEERYRRVIYKAFTTVMLARLQGDDDISDVHTERGSRVAIEFAEARDRRRVEALVPAAVREVYLPAVEREQRQHIASDENREWRTLVISSPLHLLTLRHVTEPSGRRAIYHKWCGETAHLIMLRMMFVCAAAERRQRAHVLMAQGLEHERLRMAEYLWRVEVQEWSTFVDHSRRRMQRIAQRDAAQRGARLSQPQHHNPALDETMVDVMPPFLAEHYLRPRPSSSGRGGSLLGGEQSPPFTQMHLSDDDDAEAIHLRSAGNVDPVARDLEWKRNVASPQHSRNIPLNYGTRQHSTSPSPKRNKTSSRGNSATIERGASWSQNHFASAVPVQSRKSDSVAMALRPTTQPVSLILTPVVVRGSSVEATVPLAGRRESQQPHHPSSPSNRLYSASPSKHSSSPAAAAAANRKAGRFSSSPQRVDTFPTAVMQASPALYFFEK